MSRKTTPEKPPSKRLESIAGKGLSKGKLTPRETKALSGRLLSEGAAISKKEKR